MADRAIGELTAASEFLDDSLLVVEQQGEAKSVSGGLVKGYAVAAAKEQADAAAKSAAAAKTDADRAAEKAKDAADVALHPPILKDGSDHWWTWDTGKNDYVDSGIDAGVSVQIGKTTTGPAGSAASVKNTGTNTDPIFEFTIPQGVKGDKGDKGEKGDQGNTGPVGPTGPIGPAGGVDSVNGGTGDVVIGGRNLVRQTSSDWSDWITPTINVPNASIDGPIAYLPDTKKAGDKYACAVEIEFSGVQASSSGEFMFLTQGRIDGQWGSVTTRNVWNPQVVNLNSPPVDGVYKYTGVSILPENAVNNTAFECGFRYDYWGGGKFRYRCIKLERGTVATDWSPAPEDKADVPTQFDISLPVSGWVNGQQAVKDARFVAGDYDWDVFVRGASIRFDGITITEGQMTAKADIVPTTDMTWTVTRKEVRRDG